MKTDDTDRKLEELIHNAIGRDGVSFDFQQWKQRHQGRIGAARSKTGTIEPIRSGASRWRVFKIATAALIFIGVCLGLPHLGSKDDGRSAWAQILEQMANAETITWQVTFYQTFTSEDGQRTWVQTETREQAYKAPGLTRDVTLDENGQIVRWTVTDVVAGRELAVNPGKRKAYLRELTMTADEPHSPFVWVKKGMEERTLQWVARRTTEGREVNVFRASFLSPPDNHPWSYDFWIDTETKQLVAMYVPGGDLFDPDGPASRNPPEETYSCAEATASAKHHINFNAELDDALFSTEPPEGYTLEVERRTQVTEEEMVAWLGLLAEFHNDTFPDGALPPYDVSSDRVNAIYDKAETDRTEVEQRLIDTMRRYMMANLNGMPVAHFLFDFCEKDSFRYLGKGVRLGDKDRLICWYRLKGAQTYRAVYGDLRVVDITAEELPLPVEP